MGNIDFQTKSLQVSKLQTLLSGRKNVSSPKNLNFGIIYYHIIFIIIFQKSIIQKFHNVEITYTLHIKQYDTRVVTIDWTHGNTHAASLSKSVMLGCETKRIRSCVNFAVPAPSQQNTYFQFCFEHFSSVSTKTSSQSAELIESTF